MKTQPVSFSAIAFLKLSAIVLFSYLMTEKLCPNWFLALFLSVTILQGMGLIAFKVSAHGLRMSFQPLKLGEWNTVLQFLYIALLMSDVSVPDLTRNGVYGVLAAFQVLIFFKYCDRFRQLLVRVLDPAPLSTLSESARIQ